MAMDTSSVLSDSDDLGSDYDLISHFDHENEYQHTDEDQDESTSYSVAELSNSTTYGHIPVFQVVEPPPSQAARKRFDTAGLSAEDVQAYVLRALDSCTPGAQTPVGLQSTEVRTVRVYVDGPWDNWNAEHALQLRQAKLSFPSVRLIVGVFSDELCNQHGSPTCVSHVERCEVVRHCRWVDEVITDAPWVVDESFIVKRKLDYVAVQVGASVDPAYHRDRLDGYDFLKRRGKVIPTRRTFGLAQQPRLPVPPPSTPIEPPQSQEDFDDQVHASVQRYSIGF